MLDFLFYDSLRPGGKLYETLLAGKTVFEQDVVLQDHQLYAGRGRAYLMPGLGEVEATIVRLDATAYMGTMKRLDQIAGYTAYRGGENQSERTLLKFDYELEPGDVQQRSGQAWLYVVPSERRDEIRRLPRVVSGDWRLWEAAQQANPSVDRF